MPDAVDMAADIEAEHLATGLRRALRPVPVGNPGVCDDCDEPRSRLVDGRCGYCRDGRMPPVDLDRAPTAEPAAPLQKETIHMPNPAPSADRRQISFAAKGDVLREIENRAGAEDLALGQVAIELIEAGMRRAGEAQASASELSVEQLLAALLDRVRRDEAGPDLTADLQAMTERAEAAEAKLAQLRLALTRAL